MFAFVVRKIIITYYTNIALKLVAEGRMTPEEVVPLISRVSFNISTSLIYGNAVLLFMSDNFELAALSSVVSIFVETGGKMYVVWSTWRMMRVYLDAVVKKKSGTLKSWMARAQAEPGLSAQAGEI